MKRYLTAIFLGLFMILCMGIKSSYAGEIDLLLQKLVEKGVLTGAEAQQIKVETKEAMKKEIAQGKSETLPKWIQTMKMKGDFRLRYQYNHAKTASDNTDERHRGRIRLRLGLESKVNEKLLVGVGLATGTSEVSSSNKDRARSTNQSFDATFSKKPFNLDYAYAKYMPLSWVTLIGGKMLLKDVIWEPGDLIWDTDITPEGGVVNLQKKLNSKTNLFMNTAFLVLEEDDPSPRGSGDDPWGIHIQPGVNTKISDNASLQTALAFDYWAVGGTTLANSANSNTGSTGNNANPTKDFVNLAPAFELKLKEPFKALGISFLDIPSLSFFGEYVRNLNDAKPDDNKSGFMTGFKFGAEKIEGWGDWQASYSFARLEKDAILDVLPDSDRYEGQTNMRAHEAKLTYGLGKNTYLEFDLYRAQKLSSPKDPETLFQVDWNMKF